MEDMEGRRMELVRILLKVLMWILIIGFGCNCIMQIISYGFYKNAKKFKDIIYVPEQIQLTDSLTGYGYHREAQTNGIILFFGGSNYIAYNAVAKFAGKFECPFISADYYGTQDSKGKLNLENMKRTALDLYDWAKETYPDRKIIAMGHSYGTGMATFLASERKVDKLILLAAYRDLSDLYNKMTPIFWGPFKIFISNNIRVEQYAKNVSCPVYVVGSESDRTLGVTLQKKVANCFDTVKLNVFDQVTHENYLISDEVIEYINSIME